MRPDPFDRKNLRFRPLSARKNRVSIEKDKLTADQEPRELPGAVHEAVRTTADRMRQARETGASSMLVSGAHTIKNGLAPVLIDLMREGWVTHLATNGAGIIHDWELSFCGQTSEHVAENMKRGEFGAWEETGFYVNLALNVGAFQGLGYGEAVGSLIENEGITIPTRQVLEKTVISSVEMDPWQSAAAADLLHVIRQHDIHAGWMQVLHEFKEYSVQAAAMRHAIPFTGHPMFGQDVIYEHPMNWGAAIGRTAQRDFLTMAKSVSGLSGGVYISMGSAVMSPMVFEKAFAMAQNVENQRGSGIANHHITVVDLMESHWDWSKGEPPEDNPDYYMRYNKSFSRVGGTMQYVSADNRDFLLALVRELNER